MALTDRLYGLAPSVNSKVLALKIKESQKRRLNVYFLLNQRSFWSMQSIYDTFKEEHNFSSCVVIVPMKFLSNDSREEEFEKDYLFFKEQQMNVVKGYNYETDQVVPFPSEPDIIFYQYHWNDAYPEYYSVYNWFPKALCVGVPYGVMVANIPNFQFNNPIHNLGWLNFAETSIHKELSAEYAYNKGSNVVVSGYPKMDALCEPVTKFYWKDTTNSRKKIIWAPHYSIEVPNTINFSTFHLYFRKMLELLKNNPGLEIALKPHPVLKSRCKQIGFLDDKAFDSYIEEWASLPNGIVVEEGNYLDLFKTSDAMILDSLSFISEYMFTDKPICFLSKHSCIEDLLPHFNDFGKRIIRLMDFAHNFTEVEEFINKLLLGELPANPDKTSFIKNYLRVNYGHSGRFIVDYIKKELGMQYAQDDV